MCDFPDMVNDHCDAIAIKQFFVSAESTQILVVTAMCVKSKRLLHLEF